MLGFSIGSVLPTPDSAMWGGPPTPGPTPDSAMLGGGSPIPGSVNVLA